MEIRELSDMLAELSEMHGVSGFEDSVAKRLAELIAPYADSVHISPLGSVIAHKKSGKKGAKRLMLDAHMDEIGLIVTKIDEKGFLKLTNIGGIDERILPASEVIVHGKRDVRGIIGIKPPHLQSDGESGKILKIDELAVDVGMSRAEAEEVIGAGAWVSFDKEAATLLNNQMTGKSLDDRAGVCAVMSAARCLADKELDIDVYYVISTREETNLSGAGCAAYELEPDCALVIDVTHAKTPDNQSCMFDVGEGVSYSLGPNVCTPLAQRIKEIADGLEIDARAEVDGGSTGTNAWSVQISGKGVATAVVSLPLKYMHTPAETVSLDDIAAVGSIAYEFVMSMSKDSSILGDRVIK